jgi:hypothetical protein
MIGPSSRSRVRESHALKNLENRVNLKVDKLTDRINRMVERQDERHRVVM